MDKKKIAAIAREITYNDTMIQISGKNEAVIENCKRIVELSDVYLKVSANELTVEIWGSGLKVSSYGLKRVVVRGVISSVELS